jgi:WD40 repeat protein
MSFSADRTAPAIPQRGSVRLRLPLARGTELRFLCGHEGLVTNVAFSPDGQRLVSGAGDGTVRIREAASGTELRCLRGHENSVSRVTFSPDGQRLVSGSWDNTVRVWDAARGAELRCLRGHESLVLSVTFAPDGQRLVSGSIDKTVRVWDAVGGTSLEVIRGEGDVVAIAIGAPRFPFRAIRRGLDAVIESSTTGDLVACFPIALYPITHPSGRTWAGKAANYLCLFTLEGV